MKLMSSIQPVMKCDPMLNLNRDSIVSLGGFRILGSHQLSSRVAVACANSTLYAVKGSFEILAGPTSVCQGRWNIQLH